MLKHVKSDILGGDKARTSTCAVNHSAVWYVNPAAIGSATQKVSKYSYDVCRDSTTPSSTATTTVTPACTSLGKYCMSKQGHIQNKMLIRLYLHHSASKVTF